MSGGGQKMSPQAKRTRIVALVGGWLLFVIGMGAALILNSVPLDSESILVLVISALVISLLVAGAAIGIYRDWGPPQPPTGYRKRPFELAQWQRWYNCLFLYPIFLTTFGIQAVAGVDGWLRHHHGSGLIMPAIYPLLAFGFGGGVLIMGPRGKPGTAERRNFERMNDDLTQAHAGEAFRHGFYAAFAGLAATTATALIAPHGVLYAVVGACWLAAMTTVIRFGLLQRAAEPKSGED